MRLQLKAIKNGCGAVVVRYDRWPQPAVQLPASCPSAAPLREHATCKRQPYQGHEPGLSTCVLDSLC